MITATILSRENMKPLDAVGVEVYSIELDINAHGKSSFESSRKLNVSDGDFVILKNGSEVLTQGIVSNITNTDGESLHVISFTEIETLLDQKILLENEELISSVGVEDFISECIKNNITNSNDPYVNLNYIEVVVETHTPLNKSVYHENGIFNLKTYVANIKENYGVFLFFGFSKEKLIITISKVPQNRLQIDATVSDISNYSEVYETNVLSKLVVKWKKPDVTNEDDSVTVGETLIQEFFLLNDRTVSTDKNDPNRAKGKHDMIYIESDNYKEVVEQVRNQFRSNSYNHHVEADISSNSLLYPKSELYVGHECVIKTRSHGVKNSIITKVTKSNKSDLIHLKFGHLKITLLEKLKKGAI